MRPCERRPSCSAGFRMPDSSEFSAIETHRSHEMQCRTGLGFGPRRARQMRASVTVIHAPYEYNEENLYVDLRSTVGRSLFLKCEGFNFAGSVKLKAAAEMVDAAESEGLLRPGSILVESSSGNLGVALSMLAASKGYRFVCVTDSRCNLATKRLMEALGAEVHTIVDPGSGDRVARRPAGPGAPAGRIRRPVRVAQPVRQPECLEGALPPDRPGHRPRVPPAGRAVHRGRHHRHADGLCPVLPALAPSGAGGRGRLASARWPSVRRRRGG